MPFYTPGKNTGKPVDRITQVPVYARPARRYNFEQIFN
jgi:hypothetical protein